jgi:ABC-type multidrug transport system fused ATPase/permease subunit
LDIGARSFALLRNIGRRGRIIIGAAAIATLLERIGIVGATFAVVMDRPLYAVTLGAGLAGVFFVRTVARSLLRVETLSSVIRAVSSALLADDVGLGASNVDETEMGLLDGIYAAEVLIGDHVPELLGDIPACVCMVVAACAFFPGRLVIEAGSALALGALALVMSHRSNVRSSDRAWGAFEPVLEDLSTTLRGALELVANGNTESFLSAFRVKSQRWRSVSSRAALVSFMAGRAPALAVAFGAAVVLVMDERLREPLLHGVLGRAALLASMTPAFAGLVRAWLEMSKSRARTRLLTGLLERGGRVLPHGEACPRLPTVVALDNVSFQYDAGLQPVLSELQAAFHPGEIVGVTGPNGSGKSTILALLLGLHKPTAGVITVGAIDLTRIDLPQWRSQIGYLPQRPFLPDRATVRAAMQLVAPTACDRVLSRALQDVRLWPILCSHSPRGPLETKVGTLSAGERQRLALARVLARETPLLLLDEPDANLDVEGIELLTDLLRELAARCTVVMAVHNPHLAAAADRVLRLDRDATPVARSTLSEKSA